MGTRRRLFLIFSLLALAIAGCGGGDDGETTDTAPVGASEPSVALSKEELIAQGDAICAEVNAAVGAVGSTSTGSDGQATQAADLYGGMVERLRGLGAPSDDSAGYEEFIAAGEQLAQAQSDVALAAARGEGEALVSAEAEASAALSSFQSAAADYGLEQCAAAPSAPVAGAPTGEGSEEPAEATEEEVAPEVEEEAEVAPETGGAGSEEAGGGAAAGGGTEGGGGGSSGGGSSGGVGPG